MPKARPRRYPAEYRVRLFANDVSLELMPLTLNLAVAGNWNAPIIPRGRTLPTEKLEVLATGSDNQEVLTVQLVLGESGATSECLSLVKVHIMDIPPAARAAASFDVLIRVSAKGELVITARDHTTREPMGLRVDNELKAPLSQRDVDAVVQE